MPTIEAVSIVLQFLGGIVVFAIMTLVGSILWFLIIDEDGE